MKRDELERLWNEHADPLFSFLAFRCGDRAVAEDLLADTFERALRARGRFDRRKAGAKTWLYAIALNLARDEHRRRGAERRALERLPTAGDGSDAAAAALRAVEGREALAPALARLAAEEREAISLRFGADLSVPEIARVTRQPLTTVEGRVYRALRKLRDDLVAPSEEPPPARPARPAGPPRAGSRSASR
jgi:RNA polymerase sigma factor (sigma-70 family)